MKPAIRRKLNLDVETLKTLSRAQLAGALGGIARPIVHKMTEQFSWCQCGPPE
jgi:hypothetical protein